MREVARLHPARLDGGAKTDDVVDRWLRDHYPDDSTAMSDHVRRAADELKRRLREECRS